MAKEQTILLVDDEESVRTILPLVLQSHGFTVTATATVPEALSWITRSNFDVLIADLNIGSAGDGFTVVSAMRRTQPNAVTFILTGYPAIDTALEAIRQQVDDYLIKPTEPDSLVKTIRAKLEKRQPARQMTSKRLAEILTEKKDEMIENWLSAVNADPEISRIALTDEERKDHLPQVLDSAIGIVKGTQITPEDNGAATAHGMSVAKQSTLEGRTSFTSVTLCLPSAR